METDPVGGISVNGPLLTVVVPTYLEAENLPELAKRIFSQPLPRTKLLIVDDGSPDGTGDVAEAAGPPVRWTGRRLSTGAGNWAWAQHTWRVSPGPSTRARTSSWRWTRTCLMTRATCRRSSTNYRTPTSWSARDTSRAEGPDAEWGGWRRSLSALGNLGIRAIVGLKVKDATSGFKAFRGDALCGLDVAKFRCRGFGFQAEGGPRLSAKGVPSGRASDSLRTTGGRPLQDVAVHNRRGDMAALAPPLET